MDRRDTRTSVCPSVSESSVIVIDDVSYDRSALAHIVRQGLAALKLSNTRFSKGTRVLVKPNMLAAVGAERRVTTHPDIVWAVVTVLREFGCSVLVGDSSGGGMHGLAQSHEALLKSGIGAAATSAGAEAVALETFGARNCEGQFGPWKLWLTPLLLEVDAVVNLPVFKTHTATIITGAVKNLFGLVPGHLKAKYHAELPYIPMFSRLLVDIAATVKPTVTIVDAVDCMHGDGPMDGYPYKAGKIVMSTDPFAVDHVLAALAGLDPQMVPTIRAASLVGITRSSPEELVGRAITPLPGFKLPQTVRNDWFGRSAFRMGIYWRRVEPSISTGLCTSCGKCISGCPVDAILRDRPRSAINRKKCISCLCCHELCPSGAVVLRRIPLPRRVTGLLSSMVRRLNEGRENVGKVDQYQ